MRPIEQAFALLGLTGFCETKRVIEEGIVASNEAQPDVADHWVSLGNCVNRIFAQQTCH